MRGAQTRDKSLRIRSTIIRFSARSLALSASAWPERRIVLGTDAARARALDRPRLDKAVAIDVQEALRRRADHARIGRLEETPRTAPALRRRSRE